MVSMLSLAVNALQLRENFLDAHQVARVVNLLPPRDSPLWTACPLQETNDYKQCTKLPLEADPLLKQIIERLADLRNGSSNLLALSLPVSRCLPGKLMDRLHTDVFAEREDGSTPDENNVLYLTDAHEQSGATLFPLLNRTVVPRRGSC